MITVTTGSQLVMLLTLVFYTVAKTDEHTVVDNYAFIVPLMLYLAHRIQVAFKYATLSPTEYR
jgi:hypothetical protein